VEDEGENDEELRSEDGSEDDSDVEDEECEDPDPDPDPGANSPRLCLILDASELILARQGGFGFHSGLDDGFPED
jgi:hypothetical protein